MLRSDRRGRFAVEVRLLPEPCLWCWEIRDVERGEVVDSSWSAEWAAFRSADEAWAAGHRHLERLAA